MATVAGVVGATAAVAGTASNLFASNKAADSQTQAADQTNALAQQRYDTTRSDLAPYRTAGSTALNDYLTGISSAQKGGTYNFNPGNYQQSPYYQFVLNEGLKGMQRSSAAKGNLFSGGTQKGLAQYAEGVASTDYQNWFNNALSTFNANLSGNSQYLSGLGSAASLGESAAAQTGNVGMTALGVQSNALTNAGNAQAAGAINSSNSINSGLQNAAYLSNALSGSGSGSGNTSYSTNDAPLNAAYSNYFNTPGSGVSGTNTFGGGSYPF